MKKNETELYKLYSERKKPVFEIDQVDDNGLLTLKNDHYYYFSKQIEDEEDEEADPYIFYGKFKTYNNSDSISYYNDFPDLHEDYKGKMIELHLMDDNDNLIPFNNENNLFKEGIIKDGEMTFSEKNNRFRDYVFFILKNDHSKQQREQKKIDLIRGISNRLENIDLLPFLYPNMSEPKLKDHEYNTLKQTGILLNNYVNPVFKTEEDLLKNPNKEIHFSKQIEDALKKPTKAQTDQLFRFIENKKRMKNTRKKTNSINSLRTEIQSLRLESARNTAIQNELKEKVLFKGGKAKRRSTKRRSTKKNRIQHVTTVKKKRVSKGSSLFDFFKCYK